MYFLRKICNTKNFNLTLVPIKWLRLSAVHHNESVYVIDICSSSSKGTAARKHKERSFVKLRWADGRQLCSARHPASAYTACTVPGQFSDGFGTSKELTSKMPQICNICSWFTPISPNLKGHKA